MISFIRHYSQVRWSAWKITLVSLKFSVTVSLTKWHWGDGSDNRLLKNLQKLMHVCFTEKSMTEKQNNVNKLTLSFVKLYNLSEIRNRWETFLLNSGPLLKLSEHPKA